MVIDLSPNPSTELLLIEDNLDDAALLGELLGEVPEARYRLRHAVTLQRGLELAREYPPGIVLLDLGLPDAHRLEGLARLRAALPGVPVVVLTGAGSDTLGIEAVRSGAQDFLVKGKVDASTILRAMQHSVERHQLLRLIQEARDREADRANHDDLTGLPNRALFFDRMHHLIARASRNQERFAVAYFDLNDFKAINDTLGHAAGDAVLVQVAALFSATIRMSDTLARLGGDEFGLILERVPSCEVAGGIIGVLRETLATPLRVADHNVQVSISAGVAIYDEHGLEVEGLLRHADAAMYAEKVRTRRTGRGASGRAERFPLPSDSDAGTARGASR